MRQVEEQAEQVIAHFPPISYLLTSDGYPAYLKQTLAESLPTVIEDRQQARTEIDAAIAILDDRKRAPRNRGLVLANFVKVLEIERWLDGKNAVVGRRRSVGIILG